MLSNYACQLCNKSWTSLNSYNQHISSYPHQHRMDIISAWSDDFCPPQSGGEDQITTTETQIATEVSFGDGNEKVTVDYTITEERKQNDDLTVEDLDFCSICRKYFTGPESAKAHYDSKKHQNKAYIAKSGVPTAFGECQLCGKFFTGTDQQDKHFASVKHLKKVQKAKELEENGGTEKTAVQTKKKTLALRDFGECKLCSKFFTGSDQATKHFASIKHLKKLAKSQEGEANELDPVTTELIKPAILTDQELMEIVKETIITYLASAVDRRHQRMLEEGTLFSCEDIADLLEKAVSYVVVDSFRCDICKKSFTGTKPINDHLTSKKHQQKLAQAKALLSDGTLSLTQDDTISESQTADAPAWESMPDNQDSKNEQVDTNSGAFPLDDGLQTSKLSIKEEPFEESYKRQDPHIQMEPLEDDYERSKSNVMEKPYGDGFDMPNQVNPSERPHQANMRGGPHRKRNFANQGRMSTDSGNGNRDLNPFTQGNSDFIPRYLDAPAERGRDSRRGRGGQFPTDLFRENRGRGGHFGADNFRGSDNFRGRGRKRRFFEEAPERKFPRRN